MGIAKNLKKDYYASIMSKDIAFFDARRAGDLISRLNSDIQVVQDTLGTNVSMLARSALYIISVLIIMLVISPPLTGMVFAGIIPLSVFSNFYAKWMRKLQGAIQGAKALMNTVAEESFSNVRTVKAFGSEHVEIKRFMEGNNVFYSAGVKKAGY